MKQEKKITSEMTTRWVPDLPWNTMRPGPTADAKGKLIEEPLPETERVAVEIAWPDIEKFELISAGKPSTAALFMSLTKACVTKIERFVFRGEAAETGAELLAIRGPGSRRARDLAINIGSYIFKESIVSEEEEKN